MNMQNFAEGVAIIAKYIPKGELYGLNATHDQIAFGGFDWVPIGEDKDRLLELGWFEDEESWSCMT